MEQCDFLDKLPFELRYRIYEFHLTFPSPIKIRHILPWSKELPLLRLNRQIHREALQVLYERNRVLVKYAYFCKRTSPSSKSPIRVELVRHLLIDGFGRSPICQFNQFFEPEQTCDVCYQPHVTKLIGALKPFPQLRTVVVNYHGHKEQMERLKERIMESEIFELVPVEKDPDPFSFKLQGPGLEELSVEFRWGMSGWVDHTVQDQIDWMRRL
jgi:hypothetical protein